MGGLHHVELYVDDLARSCEFWDWLLDFLGWSEFQSWEQGKSWLHGETYLVLVQTEERFRDVPYHRCRAGLNHLAFHAKSREQVDELAGLLAARSVQLLYHERFPYAGGADYYAVFFEDPQRIKVEVVAPD
jgi:catechol 2,3-dioxygenase-like lactoylglutathione lyase family enzyme